MGKILVEKMNITEEKLKQMIMEELDNILLEKCWPGYEKKGMKKRTPFA